MRLLDVALALMFGLIVDLFADWSTALSAWLTKRAARNLPRQHAERYEEEWLETLSTRPRLLRPFFALDLFRASFAITREYRFAQAARTGVSGHLYRPAELLAKRALDISLAFIVICAVAPVVLIVIALRKCTSRELVTTERPKYLPNRKPVITYKLQTGAACLDGVDVYARVDGPTERFGIDTLSMLFNVLKGSMSFVGPIIQMRPEDRTFWRYLGVPKKPRHVRQGIFSLTDIDVDFAPNVTRSFDEVFYKELVYGIVRHDRQYLQHWTFWMDVRILVRIARHMVRRQRARVRQSVMP